MKNTSKYIIAAYIPLLFLVFGLTSCGEAKTGRLTHINGFALGTFYTISVKGDTLPGTRSKIDSTLKAAAESMSVFDKSSLMSRLNDNLTDTLDRHIEYCIRLAQRISEESGGLYDITILPLVEAYGLGAKREDKNIADSSTIDSLLRYVGYDKISVVDGRLVKQNPNIRIDLNSIAKGYIVDMVAQTLEDTGIKEYMVNIGGEVYCKGTNGAGRPWRMGIETPDESSLSIINGGIAATVELTEKGMATSGNYRNFREDSLGHRYTHIINPLTGKSTASPLLSATVIADNCATADAYATMFIVLGLNHAKRFAEEHSLAALFIYSDSGNMNVWVSPAMKPYFVEKPV